MLPEFGPLPYTVTAVVAGASIEEPVVEDPVVEDPADKDLDDRDSDPSTDGPIPTIDRNIGATLTQGLSKEELSRQATSLIDQMNTIIKDTTDPAAAEDALDALGTALGTLSKVVAQLENKDQVIKNIATLTNNARHLVVTMEDNDKVTDLTAKYFNNMEQVINQLSPEEYQTKNLKNNVFKLGNQAVNKAGTFKTDPKDVTVEGGKRLSTLTQLKF